MRVTSYHVEDRVNFGIVDCGDDGSELPEEWEWSLCTVREDLDAGRGKMRSWREICEVLLGDNVDAGTCVDYH